MVAVQRCGDSGASYPSPRLPRTPLLYSTPHTHTHTLPPNLFAPQEYISHLILERLDDASIAAVAKKLLKLPWAECEVQVLSCLLKVSALNTEPCTGKVVSSGAARPLLSICCASTRAPDSASAFAQG